MSSLETMFVREGAERRVSWRRAVRAEVIAASIGIQLQRYSIFRRRRRCCTRRRPAKRLSSKSLGTTPRNTDLVRGSIAIVVDDLEALVYFQHELELGVGDGVHSGRQRVTEMHLDAQVALLYQM